MVKNEYSNNKNNKTINSLKKNREDSSLNQQESVDDIKKELQEEGVDIELIISRIIEIKNKYRKDNRGVDNLLVKMEKFIKSKFFK